MTAGAATGVDHLADAGAAARAQVQLDAFARSKQRERLQMRRAQIVDVNIVSDAGPVWQQSFPLRTGALHAARLAG